jgi:glycosyltransferase involved in cell wall biosynthesis
MGVWRCASQCWDNVKRPLTLDLSRLLTRARFVTPTGIDRVERAYAGHALTLKDRDVRFMAHVPVYGTREIARRDVAAMIATLDQQWAEGKSSIGAFSLVKLMAKAKRLSAPENAVTLTPTHHLLHSKKLLMQQKRNNGRLVMFIHDTIPSDFPEYARAGGASRHRLRLRNTIDAADVIIVNSADTAKRLQSYCQDTQIMPPVHIAPIGLDAIAQAEPFVDNRSYFVILGTIEPRKNHLLLLNLWREMVHSGQTPPRLYCVGKRGWENEQVIDMLDRCDALSGHVVECPELGDQALAQLIRGAQALLMPSFAEGYGMPVAEALAASVPVIASDLPVFREAAGDVPDYLNPLDGPGWQQAIADYSTSPSPRKAAQLARMKGWTAPDWDSHFQIVMNAIDTLS